MLNKKKLGLGMLVAGSLVTVAGAVIARKGIKEEKEREMELVELEMDSACGMDINCDECGYCEHYEDPNNFDEVEIKEEAAEKEVAVTEEEVIVAEPAEKEVVSTFSTYNPMSAPASMSQADLESFGSSTF